MHDVINTGRCLNGDASGKHMPMLFVQHAHADCPTGMLDASPKTITCVKECIAIACVSFHNSSRRTSIAIWRRISPWTVIQKPHWSC